jgi:acylphosphatase
MSQHDSNDIQELHAWVSGWVQGVGFRDFVIRKALSLGLRGYTRNDSSGDVEVLAQGKRAALEQLLSLLRRGPSAARVSDVRVQWGRPTEHFSGFHIRW